MKIYNKCGNGLSHSYKGNIYFLANGNIGDFPDEVAKIWLNIQGVEEYVAPEDLAKLKAEIEELKSKKAPAKKAPAKKTTKK
jgi:hypothetical protein